MRTDGRFKAALLCISLGIQHVALSFASGLSSGDKVRFSPLYERDLGEGSHILRLVASFISGPGKNTAK